MDCACTVEMDIDGRVTLLEGKFVKARKEHICSECRYVVPKGEEYFKETWVSYGKIEHHKTCEHCYSIRQVFFSSGWFYSQLLENIEEFIANCYGGVSVSCLLQLTPKARGMVCDMIENYWGEDDE